MYLQYKRFFPISRVSRSFNSSPILQIPNHLLPLFLEPTIQVACRMILPSFNYLTPPMARNSIFDGFLSPYSQMCRRLFDLSPLNVCASFLLFFPELDRSPDLCKCQLIYISPLDGNKTGSKRLKKATESTSAGDSCTS